MSLALQQCKPLLGRGAVQQKRGIVRSSAREPLETLLGAQRLRVLDRSEVDLAELCSEASDADACRQVLDYFKARRANAQGACVRELETAGTPGAGCQEFERLERMVYETVSAGGARPLLDLMRVEAALDARSAGAAPPRAPHAPTPQEAEEAEHQAWVEHLRLRAGAVFDALDKEGRGYVDREAFLTAMDVLHDELGWAEADLGTVFEAIDCHGHVTKEQFCDIAVAEELRDPSADAELLRHLAHSKPGWWTACPPEVSSA